MQKIFLTQLQGLVTKMNDTYEGAFEDGARLMAQSIVSGGRIGIYASGDMEGVVSQAIKGVDRLEGVVEISSTLDESFSEMDTVLLFSPSPNEAATCMLADQLRERGVSTVAVYTGEKRDDSPSLEDLADAAIDLGVTRGLIPGDDGRRKGQPRLLVALYAYYTLYFTVEEILEEHR
ncbi:hypothetical protein CR205_17240 [Alteribacter lacisalsi]|uniref:DUF2529 domain-containing protein n=1 Tax=Alteribacter lacisalsi TaxID=2045244 RepID=A0A2W0HGT4_9BACI|nr:DUF2529 family protein [Alteribacter lacisalsi]PYZ96112.1 hypothetical protein CR205_17240 [Alteribacter lacisalsi]